MMQTYLAFAKTGNPNNERLPDWPTYNPTDRAVMTLNHNSEVVNSPSDEERDFWASLAPRELSRVGG